MTIKRALYGKNAALMLGFIFFLYHAKVVRQVSAASNVFDVTKFGAKGNGKPDYDEDGESTIGLSFMKTWSKACNSKGPSKVLIPKGAYVVAQIGFSGPCQSSVTVELQGDLIADPDVSQFPNSELLVFNQVEGAKLIGPGSISVNRPSSSITAIAPEQKFIYMEVFPSISLKNVTNFELDGIHSLDPEAFHILVDSSRNVSISNVNLEAKDLKVVTHSDAIFISMSSLVTITNIHIKTGDSCVTVSGGSKDVSVSGVTCLNGQGISVGALPHSTDDYNIKGVKVQNCTFTGTKFGARINPRAQEKLGEVSDIVFEDLVMDNAENAITIKQDYPSTPEKPQIAKVTNVQFKNIRGTIATNSAISFSCSKASPCDAIQVADVDLKFTGKALDGKAPSLSATCANANVQFTGKHDGLSCM